MNSKSDHHHKRHSHPPLSLDYCPVGISGLYLPEPSVGPQLVLQQLAPSPKALASSCLRGSCGCYGSNLRGYVLALLTLASLQIRGLASLSSLLVHKTRSVCRISNSTCCGHLYIVDCSLMPYNAVAYSVLHLFASTGHEDLWPHGTKHAHDSVRNHHEHACSVLRQATCASFLLQAVRRVLRFVLSLAVLGLIWPTSDNANSAASVDSPDIRQHAARLPA